MKILLAILLASCALSFGAVADEETDQNSRLNRPYKVRAIHDDGRQTTVTMQVNTLSRRLSDRLPPTAGIDQSLFHPGESGSGDSGSGGGVGGSGPP